MTHIQKFRKMSLLLVAALALTGLFSNRAYASHFRYSTIQWSADPANPRKVTFQIQSAWRWDYPWSPTTRPAVGTTVDSFVQFAFGDGNSAELMLTVTAVDSVNDWMVATTTLTHTYAGDGPYTAGFLNCCRLSTLLDNNHDTEFIVRTVLHLSSTVAEQSPSASSVPIIVLPAGVTSTFQIPASDPDGTIASYAFPTPALANSGLNVAFPPGLTMSSSGLVQWTPTIGQQGLHAMQVWVTDNDGNRTPLDVILSVIPNAGGTRPTVLINNSAAPVTVNAQVGVPLNVQVGATDPDTDPATGNTDTLVTLGSGGLPVGGQVAPVMPFTQRVPESATFSWTPTVAQGGQTFTVVFSATDNTGLQGSNSVTIHVASPNPPVLACAPASYVGQAGSPLTLTASVSDPNKLPVTVTWAVDGSSTVAQTDNVPGGASDPTALSFDHTFAVGPHTVAVTATNSFFATSTCHIAVDISKANQTITFPVIAPLTFGDAPVALSASSDSSLPVAFEVVSGPGTISGNLLTITGAGTIQVKATQAGDETFNPADAVTQYIAVQKATPTVNATGGTFTYDAQPHAATVSVTGPDGTALTPVTVTYNGLPAVPVDAGTYNVAVSFAGDANNASISGTTTIQINQATPVVSVAGGTFGYDGLPHPASTTVTGVGGVVLTPVVVTYAGQSAVPVHAGTYPVLVSFAGNTNYLPASGTATIQINKVTPVISASGGTFDYNGQPHPAVITATGVGGDVLSPVTVTYGGQSTPPVNAGTYPVSVSFAGNMDYLPATGTATVTINPVPLTIGAASGSMVYGGIMPPLTATYAGFVGTDGPASLTTPAVLATMATPTSPVGTYPITVSGASSPNYAITFVNGLLTVTPATLTITADNQTKWFGAAMPSLTVTYAGFVNGDTAASLTTPVVVTTTAQALSPSGTYPILVSGATDPNYAITFVNGTLTVLGLQQVKTSARAAIAALKPTGSRQLDHELDEVLRHIDASLEPRLWADDSHLTPKGQKVFEEEKQAVRELEEQFRGAPASLSTELGTQADVLIRIDRALAQVALDEATAAGADARRMADASADLLEGDRKLASKGGDDAIERYKSAWHDVEQALHRLTDSDGDHGGDHDHGPRR